MLRRNVSENIGANVTSDHWIKKKPKMNKLVGLETKYLKRSYCVIIEVRRKEVKSGVECTDEWDIDANFLKFIGRIEHITKKRPVKVGSARWQSKCRLQRSWFNEVRWACFAILMELRKTKCYMSGLQSRITFFHHCVWYYECKIMTEHAFFPREKVDKITYTVTVIVDTESL